MHHLVDTLAEVQDERSFTNSNGRIPMIAPNCKNVYAGVKKD